MEKFTMEKYNEFAGIVSENELDEMLDEDTVGGATSLPCITAVTALITCFANCPTTACSNSCRF